MTSGNIAVFDHDALRHIDYVSEFHKLFELNTESAQALCQRLRDAIVDQAVGRFRHRRSSERQNADPQDRSHGGRQNGRACRRKSCTSSSCPFTARAKSRSGRSATRTWRSSPICLREIAPGQIYVAGDLSDPHGTHRVCAQAIFERWNW